MGNDSGELGHNLMDHHFQVGASGVSDKHEDKYFTVEDQMELFTQIS